MKDFDTLALHLKREFPKFRISIKEDSRWWRFVYAFTLMKLWNPEFLTQYTTTIKYHVWIPRDLIGTDRAYGILRHEAIHMRDYSRYGIWMDLSYVLLLPFVVTLRAWWEYRAYTETMRVEAEQYGSIDDSTIEWLVGIFCGTGYLWMFPFPKTLRKLLNGTRNKIMKELNANPRSP